MKICQHFVDYSVKIVSAADNVDTFFDQFVDVHSDIKVEVDTCPVSIDINVEYFVDLTFQQPLNTMMKC